MHSTEDKAMSTTVLKPSYKCPKCGRANYYKSSEDFRPYCSEKCMEDACKSYRAKSAAMVHKASGDPEQVCKDGLQVFDALSPARERANKTAKHE